MLHIERKTEKKDDREIKHKTSISVFSKEECAALLNHLSEQKKISILESKLLIQQLDTTQKDFCRSLLDCYNSRAKSYLKNAKLFLTFSHELQPEVAEDISISHAYAQIAIKDKNALPFVLMTSLRGLIHEALQESASIEIISLMQVGVAVGFYSIIPYLIALLSNGSIPPYDDATLRLSQTNTAVFEALVPIWQLYMDIGINNLLKLNLTAEKPIPSSLLLGLEKHSQNSINESFKYLMKYIQLEIIQPHFQYYVEHANRDHAFYRYIQKFLNITFDKAIYDMRIGKDRFSLTKSIYYLHYKNEENQLSMFNDIAQIFNSLDNNYGNVCNPAARLINLATINPKEKELFIKSINEMTTSIIEEKLRKLEELRQAAYQHYRQQEKILTHDKELIQKNASETKAHFAVAKASLDKQICEIRIQLSQYWQALVQCEAQVNQDMQIQRSALDHQMNQLHNEISRFSKGGFFASAQFNMHATKIELRQSEIKFNPVLQRRSAVQ